ncbi:hypothetical protein HN385_06025 [archaeon]|jgi:hypothetical protein|nr:hypothetical protein [archaeon]
MSMEENKVKRIREIFEEKFTTDGIRESKNENRLKKLESMRIQKINTRMHDMIHAKQFLFKNIEDEPRLSLFAGRSFLIGSIMNIPMLYIHEYIFNTNSMLYYDVLPTTVEEIKEDMIKYFEYTGRFI